MLHGLAAARNVLVALVLIVAPWVLSGDTSASRWNDIAAGIAIVAFSLPRGRVEERFGSWNRYLTW